MDLFATLAQPLGVVFRHVAAPRHLGDWLVDVVGVEASAAGPPDIGAVFALTLRAEGHVVAATGELVAYEPPWLAAYRLCVGARQHVLRLACTAGAGGTHLHVHQADGSGMLAVDLARLARAVAAAGAAGEEAGAG